MIDNDTRKYRKLTPELITKLSGYMAEGLYASTACQLCGITQASLYSWLQQAEIDISNGMTRENSRLIALHESLKESEGEAERNLVKTVREAATENKNWLAAMTMLERRHPDRWGRRDRRQIDITERKDITISHVEVVLNEPGRPEVIEGTSRELLTPGQS